MSNVKVFNNIKIHTQYSICEGAIKIEDLANKADYKLSISNGNIKRANV